MKLLTLSPEQVCEGSLILVNRKHAFRKANPEPLVPVGGRPDVLLCRQAADALESLMAEICGWQGIVPVSGWRSLEEQQKIWDDTLKERGLVFTQKYVAVPGHSEHQTGFAIDLGLNKGNIDFICPDFPDAGICQKFRERAADYGFVERYPAAKEQITGIAHEPWHFRYVGVPHAKIMRGENLTLEEYLTFVKQFRHGYRSYDVCVGGTDVHVSYCPVSGESDTQLAVGNRLFCSVSGNNCDGFVVTEWRRTHENKGKLRWD